MYIGQIVHYYPHANEVVTAPGEAAPEFMAAIVVKILSPYVVNLTVFDARGQSHGKQTVAVWIEGQERPLGGYCADIWPKVAAALKETP